MRFRSNAATIITLAGAAATFAAAFANGRGVAQRDAVSLPGACVSVPNVSFETFVTVVPREGSERRMRYGAATDRTRDLDGDGQSDVLVPHPRERNPQTGCPEDVRWEAYLTRGACGVRVGMFEGDFAGIDREHLAHGLPIVLTTIPPGSPADERVHLRYALDGAVYTEVQRTSDEARCQVHPADCSEAPFRRCELRGHPTIPSLFDVNAVGLQLNAAAALAQQTCAAPSTPVERCDVHPTFARDGHLAALEVRDCPHRRMCVRQVFQTLRSEPYTGDAAMPSVSFQIPAP